MYCAAIAPAVLRTAIGVTFRLQILLTSIAPETGVKLGLALASNVRARTARGNHTHVDEIGVRRDHYVLIIFGDFGLVTISPSFSRPARPRGIDPSPPIPRHSLGEDPNYSLCFDPVATITV